MRTRSRFKVRGGGSPVIPRDPREESGRRRRRGGPWQPALSPTSDGEALGLPGCCAETVGAGLLGVRCASGPPAGAGASAWLRTGSHPRRASRGRRRSTSRGGGATHGGVSRCNMDLTWGGARTFARSPRTQEAGNAGKERTCERANVGRSTRTHDP